MKQLRAGRLTAAAVAVVAAALALGASVAGAHRADSGFDSVVSGLGNPRGLAFGEHGQLYVAEGGDGGPLCMGAQGCVGLTSKITKVDVRQGTKSDFITGLLSLGGSDKTGTFVVGATGVSVIHDTVFALMGGNPSGIPDPSVCAGAPDCLAAIAAAQNLGGVLDAEYAGDADWEQNVGAFNYQWTVDNNATIPLDGWQSCTTSKPPYRGGTCNPDFNPGDANPYAIAAGKGGNYVVDGGSNTLTWVPRHGDPKVLAALPNPPPPTGQNPYDAVPTCVTPLKGGKLLIADLNGRVFIYDGSTMFPTPQTLSGTGSLVSAGGCAADRKGKNVYISDIFAGNVVKLSLRDMSLTPVAEGLTFPTGVAVSAHGAVYVANNGVCPSTVAAPIPMTPCTAPGEIVRLHGR
jgi:hypothetical protein